jgi:large repetitive protein
MRTVSAAMVLWGLTACGDKEGAGPSTDTGGIVDSGDSAVDADGDGFVAGDDCDDADPNSWPGADERCDGVDNDCDDQVDESPVDGSIFFADTDGDGFGAADASTVACAEPTGFVVDDTDCDDTAATVSPGADELCNAVDDDCDGDIDEDDAVDATVWYEDADGDGYGDPDATQLACSLPEGCVENADDCSDATDTAWPGADEICDGIDNDCNGEVDEDASADAAEWHADTDADGFGDAAEVVVQCAQPTGYVLDATDCDDTANAVFPGADELCNGVDDDCAGDIDEDDAVDVSTWYADADSDGYGDPSSSDIDCAQPSGFVADNTDCDDTVGAVNPGATEVCNRVDDDCDALVDDLDSSLDTTTGNPFYADTDADGYGDAAAVTWACSAPTGQVTDDRDCDDADAAVNPGATEVCNSVDDDCDGAVDDDDSGLDLSTAGTWYVDGDSDGYGDAATGVETCVQPSGTVTDATDCDDTTAAISPADNEICNGVDDDCDGDVDDDDASLLTSTADTWYADTDGDGYGDAASTTLACAQPTGFLADATDCDDASAISYPGADEWCDTEDNDCDGTIDESDAVDAGTWYADTDADGFGDASSSSVACTQPTGSVADGTDCDDATAAVYPGATEVCSPSGSSIDDDCDGLVDDDDPSLDTTTADTWHTDSDSDGYGDASTAALSCDQPAGAVADDTDCDDASSTTYPGADEYCDGEDDDCDGSIDEDAAVDVLTWYADTDGDTYGDAASTDIDCDQPSGFVSDATDCDDTDATVNPVATEVWYDGVDQDCDTASDYDADGDAYDADSHGGTDCDDTDGAVSPAAAEIWYDGVDQNCDAAGDYDADGDGYDSDAYGGTDCDDTEASAYVGGTDVWYDGIDGDCDGFSDYDADQDGFDSDAYGGDDCDDTDHHVHPYAFDAVSDGVDNDCDGDADTADPDTIHTTSLSDDDYERFTLSGGFPLCGSTWTSGYVQSNGQLTFGFASADFSPSVSELESDGVSIAGFWDDLDPSGASSAAMDVVWIDYGDAVGVYWNAVPRCCTTSSVNSNTFGIVIMSDGTILLEYDGIDEVDPLVGWACGTGSGSSVDLSAAWAARSPDAAGIGTGTELSYYQDFSSGFDLDGETLYLCGTQGTDGDGDGYTDECGDPDDTDASATP